MRSRPANKRTYLQEHRGMEEFKSVTAVEHIKDLVVECTAELSRSMTRVPLHLCFEPVSVSSTTFFRTAYEVVAWFLNLICLPNLDSHLRRKGLEAKIPRRLTWSLCVNMHNRSLQVSQRI